IRRYLPGHELPGHDVTSLFHDDRGRMWVGIDNDLYRLEPGGQFTLVRRPDGQGIGVVQSMATAQDGTLWAQTTSAHPHSTHLVSVPQNEVTTYPPFAEGRSAISM